MAKLKLVSPLRWPFKRDLSLNSPAKWFALFGGDKTSSGAEVDQETSLKFTAVLAAVSLRGDLVAASPKEIMVSSGKNRQPDYKHPLYRILAYEPNPFMNAYTWWELNHTYLDLWGNAYNLISRQGKKVTALSPIHPARVKVEVKDGKLVYTVDGTGNSSLDGEHAPKDILHFRDLTLDGYMGQSRIMLAREAIGLGLAAEKFGGEFFGNGSQARGVIEHPTQMGDDAYNRFKQSWESKDNMSTPILEEGMVYKQITIPPEAAQFIASREFQVQDVSRIFRIPPPLLGDLSRATFSNIENLDLQMVKYTIRPLVKRYEQECELKLLSDLGKENIRFNLDGILRGDTAARSAYYTVMKQMKIMTTNEIRALENMNPIEGGDILENPSTSSNNGETQGSNGTV